MSLRTYLKQTRLGRLAKRLLRRRRPAPTLLRMLRKLHPGERLPEVRLPEPYHLTREAPGGTPAWLDLLNASGEFGRWSPERLQAEIGTTLLPGGTAFVAHGDRLVGCASVCDMAEFRPFALLMYVAVLPEHRGRGLGRALVLEIMRVAGERQFPGLLLHTETRRLAAVRTYFQLGFLPRLGPGACGESQWAAVLNRAFFHPASEGSGAGHSRQEGA